MKILGTGTVTYESYTVPVYITENLTFIALSDLAEICGLTCEEMVKVYSSKADIVGKLMAIPHENNIHCCLSTYQASTLVRLLKNAESEEVTT